MGLYVHSKDFSRYVKTEVLLKKPAVGEKRRREKLIKAGTTMFDTYDSFKEKHTLLEDMKMEVQEECVLSYDGDDRSLDQWKITSYYTDTAVVVPSVSKWQRFKRWLGFTNLPKATLMGR